MCDICEAVESLQDRLFWEYRVPEEGPKAGQGIGGLIAVDSRGVYISQLVAYHPGIEVASIKK